MARDSSIPGGVVHPLPTDLEAALNSSAKALATWQDITPLARNEWICWVKSAKQSATRNKRISWRRENLEEGKRRLCCWPGCAHRQRNGSSELQAGRGAQPGGSFATMGRLANPLARPSRPLAGSCPPLWCNCGGVNTAISGGAGSVRRPRRAGVPLRTLRQSDARATTPRSSRF